MKRLIKVFDEKENIENVLVPLSIDIDEVVFIYHHDIDKKALNSTYKVLHKYKEELEVKDIYIKDEKNETKALLDKNTIVDVSASRYLTLCILEEANKLNLDVIYYDATKNVIRFYDDRKQIIDNIYKLTIDDIVLLGGGTIESKSMHNIIKDDDVITKNKIIKAVELNINNYPAFTNFVQRINNFISNKKIKSCTYQISDYIIKMIINDKIYKRLNKIGLFKIENNKLIFYNETIESLFNISGSFLENYLYITLKNSNLFDEVKMSCVIDLSNYYDKYPIKCEIDLIVSKDNHLLFISCKSNKVDVQTIYEIKVHNFIFGNDISKAVICTLNDLNVVSPSVYLKAEELKTYIIDKTAFIKKEVSKTVLDIIDNKYIYEEV